MPQESLHPYATIRVGHSISCLEHLDLLGYLSVSASALNWMMPILPDTLEEEARRREEEERIRREEEERERQAEKERRAAQDNSAQMSLW